MLSIFTFIDLDFGFRQDHDIRVRFDSQMMLCEASS